MKQRVVACLAAFFALAGSAAAAPRLEIPIRQTVLPDGNIRYSVPVSVGSGATFDAMLDSGSTGLRVLPGTLDAKDYEATGRSSVYAYGSGAQLTGIVANAVVTLGGQSTTAAIPIEVIQSVGCIDSKPECPASRVSQAEYGIGGDGIARAGFKAIIGTSLRAAEADNPLASIGDGVWIIELPVPGDPTPGRLILNPGADEIAGFTLFTLPPQLAAIPGCLVNMDNKEKVCGRVLLDTGAPVMAVEGTALPTSFPWAPGSHVVIGFQNDAGQQVGAQFVVHGNGASPFNLAALHANLPFMRISGSAPFFAFSVLFDGKHRAIGLKAR